MDSLGFDITLIVSLCFLIYVLRFAWKHVSEQFSEYFMSSIRIDSDDDIYDHVMEWIGVQNVSKRSRKLMAKSGRENAWDLVDGDAGMPDLDSNKLVNFSNWEAKVPPKFQPSFGVHRFFHQGRLFHLTRENKQVMRDGSRGISVREEENIALTCAGRSAQPIKDLINIARDHYLKKEKSCTVVRRPSPKEQRGRGRSPWMKVATRPSRPMATVVLDHEQKKRVLLDINEYLHPSTPRWYANRGIPYQRGYLFHGPPGTGKSSLAWAIAGVFGLDIYCISLVDPSLTEEDLGMMFATLPRRCVVLLEDIDSAGLSKRQEAEIIEDPKAGDESAAKIGAEITRAIKSVRKNGQTDRENQGISLSGLLNAIDGVASHEGRVLLMTTNFPDKLDEALIRPGRVDMKVKFTEATRFQIYELFTRMYSADTPASLAPEQIKLDSIVKANGNVNRGNLGGSFLQLISPKVEDVMTPSESPRHANTPTTPYSPSSIEEIATQFADSLPEDEFTPAEIQGYLLTRKKEPLKALEGVGAWRDEMLKAKQEKGLGKTEIVS